MTLASRGRAVTLVALLLLVGVYVRALAFTPLERFQGAAQKIFYLHVPAAWSAMLAMALVGLASVLYLLVKDPRYDRFAAASADRTLHPQPIVLKPSAPSLPGVMLVTLLYSFGVFTLLYIGFVMQRYAIGEEATHA